MSNRGKAGRDSRLLTEAPQQRAELAGVGAKGNRATAPENA
jgi:hypothetical protein